MFAIEDPFRSTVENISDMFVLEGEIGGDPGWEIQHYLNDDGHERFDVWLDPRVSGLAKPNGTYDADVVRRTTREVLNAFADAHPGRRSEVDQLLIACNL
jgi:hypothetical protein